MNRIQTPRRWETIADTISQNPFSAFDSILSDLDLDKAAALEYFTLDFLSAVTNYTDEYIMKIFEMVYHTNKIKYLKLAATAKAEYDPISNYDMRETSTDIRTPNLTHELTLDTSVTMTDTRQTTAQTNNTRTNTIKQVHETVEIPQNFSETSVHAINPYDNPGFTDESKDTVTQSGTRKTTDTYSGDPDEMTQAGTSTVQNTGGTSTANSGTNTQTETGTETTTHMLSRSGNIGVTTSQQMLASEMALAEKMNIFKLIEQDIAAKLFLQVWI